MLLIRVPDPDPHVLGLPDPDADPLEVWTRSKKNLDSYCFVTSFGLFIFEKYVNVPSKSKVVMSRNFFLNLFFLAS
jgi:hypothetical protein